MGSFIAVARFSGFIFAPGNWVGLIVC